MIEFEMGGHQYRIAKLNAIQQFHISRKISPLLPPLIPIFLQIMKQGGVSKDLGAVAELVTPFAEGLAGMNDQDAEYVLLTCLSVVSRKADGKNWTPVWSDRAKACMFDDMDMGVMIPLAVRVIQDSLAPFIKGMLTSQKSIPELAE